MYLSCAGGCNGAEDAAACEVREEIGLEARKLRFNHSHNFAPSNTLMLNFTVTVDDEEAHPNWEVDSWQWFPIEEARRQIKPGSLAEAFLNGYLDGVWHFPS